MAQQASLLTLRFTVRMNESGFEGNGPRFSEWLPDGHSDAIHLETNDPDCNLQVWFERCGYVEHGKVKFDESRRDIAPSTLFRQRSLQGGPLFGLLEIRRIPAAQIAAVHEDRRDDPQYMVLGKRVLGAIYEPVATFVNLLRTNYGQYWLRPLEPWDSRDQSLATYFNQRLSLRWIASSQTITEFAPGEWKYEEFTPIGYSAFAQPLTQDTWREIQTVVSERYTPSPAAFMVVRTQRLLHQKNLRHAVVEGVAALEAALGEFMRNRLAASNDLAKNMEAFWTLPLRTQTI